jgi:hypothetical protein
MRNRSLMTKALFIAGVAGFHLASPKSAGAATTDECSYWGTSATYCAEGGVCPFNPGEDCQDKCGNGYCFSSCEDYICGGGVLVVCTSNAELCE